MKSTERKRTWSLPLSVLVAAVNDAWPVPVYYFPLMANNSTAFTQ